MKPGRFWIEPDKAVLGELYVQGRESSLVVRDFNPFFVPPQQEKCITGVLHDFTKVTLIGCVITSAATRSRPNEDDHPHEVKLFPHFVVQGSQHLDPRQADIRRVSFTFEDAHKLFYDVDAFGALHDCGEFIQPIVEANAKRFQRTIPVGPAPEIAYFTGKKLIVETNTAIGVVRAHHLPSISMGGPNGVRIDNAAPGMFRRQR